jgi:hypothetical protein
VCEEDKSMKWVGKVACAALLVVAWSANPAGATVVVGFAYPEGDTVVEGESIDVQIVADIPVEEPIVGWGLDLAIDVPTVASVLGTPVVDAAWDGAPFNPDGDGLAGLVATPPGLGLTGLRLLATVTIQGDLEGITGLTLSDNNPDDLAEGFAIQPPPAGVFADVVYNPGQIEVIPEPATLTMLALCGLALVGRRR